jgi:microcystin-dependent protein
LTDRFIVGAGSSYAVNGTGGANSVTLVTGNLPAHTHTATSVVTDPGHLHSAGVQLSASTGQNASGAPNFINSVNTGTATTGITVATTNASTGSGTSFSIVPLYYALAFIQKS